MNIQNPQLFGSAALRVSAERYNASLSVVIVSGCGPWFFNSRRSSFTLIVHGAPQPHSAAFNLHNLRPNAIDPSADRDGGEYWPRSAAPTGDTLA